MAAVENSFPICGLAFITLGYKRLQDKGCAIKGTMAVSLFIQGR
jgi:hypothetical protein